MRISTSLLHQQGVATILDNQAAVAKTQLQLSTGRRIVQPSDDPTGSMQAMGLKQLLAEAAQYGKNADAARARLELEETALAQAGDILQRVRELAVRGLNGTLGAAERDGIAIEVRQRLTDLLAVANTRDANGEFLFSGFYKGTAEAFVDNGGGSFAYNGDQGQRQLQISRSRQVAVGDHGADVFLNIPASGGGTQSAFVTLQALASDLEANSPTQASLNDIDRALENILGVRASVGARLNAVESQQAAYESLQLTVEGQLSDVQDLDYAEAVSRLNRQMLALQAAQQTYTNVQGLSLFDFLR
jgi:flagellar hook-associated protein 3 FlgL